MERSQVRVTLLSSLEFVRIDTHEDGQRKIFCEGQMHILETSDDAVALNVSPCFFYVLRLCQKSTKTDEWVYVLQDSSTQQKVTITVLAGDLECALVLEYCLHINTVWKGDGFRSKLSRWFNKGKRAASSIGLTKAAKAAASKVKEALPKLAEDFIAEVAKSRINQARSSEDSSFNIPGELLSISSAEANLPLLIQILSSSLNAAVRTTISVAKVASESFREQLFQIFSKKYGLPVEAVRTLASSGSLNIETLKELVRQYAQ